MSTKIPIFVQPAQSPFTDTLCERVSIEIIYFFVAQYGKLMHCTFDTRDEGFRTMVATIVMADFFSVSRSLTLLGTA